MSVLQELQAHFHAGPASLGSNAQTPALWQEAGMTVARFKGLELRSHFQPLFYANNLALYAHEALLRPRLPLDTHFQAPNQAFELAASAQEAIYLDRLCRVLHAMNFVGQRCTEPYLFLNVSAQHLQSVTGNHGQTFEALLTLCGLRPQQVVLEILEARVEGLEHLQNAVQGWRQRGFQIAIDDFGCQHSNFDRLWRLTPDIVKLDRQLVHHAEHNPRAAIILPKLIDMIHDLGARVVCEGIETPIQHRLCVDAGADVLQGYFYARPAAQLFKTPIAADRSEHTT